MLSREKKAEMRRIRRRLNRRIKQRQDEENWIVVHGGNGEGKGVRVLLDDEEKVKGGAGGALNGRVFAYAKGSAGKSAKEDKHRKSLEEKTAKVYNRRVARMTINDFPKDDDIYLDAFSIEGKDGYEDMFLHGNANSVQITVNGKPKNLSPKEYAAHIKKNGYKGGSIRLCSCSTGKGENSFAQRLSVEIPDVIIMAPNDEVALIPEDGIMFIGSEFRNTGIWRYFRNGEEINED